MALRERTIPADHPDVATLPSLSFKQASETKLGYVPALDGLRALAIIAVMLFHFPSKELVPGGSLGVDLFFVLSGFLITTLLLQEWAASGGISIPRFYARRALRLLPAVLAFLFFFTAVAIAFNDHHFTQEPPTDSIVRNVGFAVVYIYNWIGASGDYRVPGMGHLWSLAIEEQYYLFWPGLLALILYARPWPAVVLSLSVVALLLSASIPFWWHEADFNRLFFGTDFRLQALLAGSILGQIYAAGLLKRSVIAHPVFKVSTAGCSFVLLLLLIALRNREPFAELGGYTFVAIAFSLLLAAVIMTPSGWASKLLSKPLLTYVGKRSYSLYLWHYPFAFWLGVLPSVLEFLLAFALSFLAAELSYRLVELPALRYKSRFTKSTDQVPTSSRGQDPVVAA